MSEFAPLANIGLSAQETQTFFSAKLANELKRVFAEQFGRSLSDGEVQAVGLKIAQFVYAKELAKFREGEKR